jgi:hypothetical protein
MSTDKSTEKPVKTVFNSTMVGNEANTIVPSTTAKPVGSKSWLDIIQPFVIGGLSGCLATMIIQPIDMIKVTIQLKSE